jgi:uncharacterized protein (TIGR03067 family)
MRCLVYLGLVFCGFLFLVIAAGPCKGEVASKEERGEHSLVGPWHADSVALLSDKGGKKVFPKNEQQPFSVVISEKGMVMRVGAEKFAEMSYTADAKQTPAAIDTKFQGQDMPGIFGLKGDALKISLNDAKNGRPTDFGAKDNDMDLVLHRFKGEPLMVLNADGTNYRTLLSMPEYTSCGSPEWSHDGSKITFDAWRSVYGENHTASHVFVVNSDGTSPKDLGDGTLPSWSPDGKRIAYGRYVSGNSVWIMNADGSDMKLIGEGIWSPDWSPKGDEIAFTGSSPDSYAGYDNICVFDLKTQKRRYILDRRYRQVYWGLSWSSDGKWICFKGDLPDGSPELAIVNVQGQDKGFKVLVPDKGISGVRNFDRYFSWSPDGKQILAPMTMRGDVNLQLYILDPEGKTPPKKLAGQNPSVRNYGSSWSPDGKKIVLTFWPGHPAE